MAVDDVGVTYQVKPSGKQVYRTRRLDGESFVRAFAQHILPPGFQKVRYYGFMSSNCKLQLATARWLVWFWRGWTYYLASRTDPPEWPKRTPQCKRCGGELTLIVITGASGQLIWHGQFPSRGPPHLVAPTLHGSTQ